MPDFHRKQRFDDPHACQASRQAIFDTSGISRSGWAATHSGTSGCLRVGFVTEAFSKLIDRLLASPQYGERWARHWLDVARYADGSGQPDRRPVFLGYGMARDGYANTWRYRDWVIEAFNEDMPYDRFVRAQIAADLMPDTDRSKLLPALGF